MIRFSRKQNDTLTAIVPGTAGTAVAAIRTNAGNTPSLDVCSYSPGPLDSANDLHSTLSGRRHCTTLLADDEYQLVVVDAPDVPAQELRAAVRWRIQELIDFPVDEAVLDVFDAPPSGPAGARHQLYVVVARNSTIENRAKSLAAAGASLAVIDIPEMALRNLAKRIPEDAAGLVTLYFGERHCLITITHAGVLYLSRHIEIGYRQLQENAANPQALGNRLALEIQRSMDYYEHHYHQAAAQSIAILPLPVTLYGLEDMLQQSLGLPARILRMQDIIEGAEEPDTSCAAECMLAVGSALRNEQRAL